MIRLPLALLVPLLSATPPATDPIAQAVAERTAEATAAAASPGGTAALLRLEELRDYVSDAGELDRTLEKVAASPTTDGFTRTSARLLLLQSARDRAQLSLARAESAALGFIQSVYVLGSFENEGKSGCDTDFGPEASLDLKASYPAKGQPARWRPVTLKALDGAVDLGAALHPNRSVVAYALALLEEPTARRVTLGLGTSGAFRLFVNGEKVASDDAYHPARVDQARLSVQLRRGVNRLLLKVCQDGAVPLGFFLRDESGHARAIQPANLPALPAGPAPKPVHLPTLTSRLEALAAAHPADASLLGDAAAVFAAARGFDELQHAAAVYAAKAAALAAQQGKPSPRLELLAARLDAEDVSARRGHLEAAVAAGPDNAEAAIALAQHELNAGFPARARELLERWDRDFPTFAPAQLLLARVDEEMGDPAASTLRIERLYQRTPQVVAVAREAVRASRRLERSDEAARRLTALLQERPGDSSTLLTLSALLADLGRVQEAEALLERALGVEPVDNSTRLRLAELLSVNGALEEGLKRFEEAEALAPTDAEVPERKGRALLGAGRRDAAISAFEHSLLLHPQNPALQEALRTLRDELRALPPGFAIDVAPLVAQADTYTEDAVTLVDNTLVRVQASGQSTRYVQLVVKVFSQRGVDAFRALQVSTYSPGSQEVRVIRARITRPDGSVVDTFGDTDRSVNEPWAGMFYDVRARVLSFPTLAPGDLLDVQFQVDDVAPENLLSDYFGDLVAVEGGTPKLRWQYAVEMPPGRTLYWNEKTLAPGVKVSHEPLPEGRTLHRFALARVPRLTSEPAMPGWAEVASTLSVSTYRTWEEVGRYYWRLIRDQLRPDASVRAAAEEALTGVDRKDRRAVVRALYDYVVSRTRYVALEFGIHGYQPYPVDRVLARRFGDCKDKASLLHALLEAAGVDSRIVLLRMRSLGAVPAEPASLAVFNHAILYVPSLDWYLDGTAEFHGATELPAGDHQASILVVEPSAPSRFTTTPPAAADGNVTDVRLELSLRPAGTAEVKAETRIRGTDAPAYRRSYQTLATRRTNLERAWSQAFPGLSVGEVTADGLSELDRDVTLDFQMHVPRYAEVSPAGLRFRAFPGSHHYLQGLAPLAERSRDLMLDGPTVSRFHFVYQLPRGYVVDELPHAITTETPFGHAQFGCRAEAEALDCTGEVALTTARVSPTDYPAFRAFLTQVDQAFARKVLVRPTGSAVR
jgi:tetratricopeptide (TPR) repeat protein